MTRKEFAVSCCNGPSRAVLVAVLSGSPVVGETPTVVLSNIAGTPSANVPGMPGFTFVPNLPPSSGRVFERPSGSPDGARWILRVFVRDTVGGGYHAIVRGSGTTAGASSIVLLAGQPVFFDAAVTYGSIRQEVGVGNDGSFAFAADTTAPTNSDYIVARWTPDAGFSLVAREGVQAPEQPPGVGYGSNGGDVHVLDNGDVAFGSGGLTGSGSDAVFINSAIDDGFVLFQDGVSIPDNQMDNPPAPLWFPYSFRTDATGETYIYDGMLTNFHNVVVVNNVVVAEHGMPLPGGYPGFFYNPEEAGERVSPYNGHYAFRAPTDLDGDDFYDGDVVVVDDRVVAASGDPIFPGSEEYWHSGDITAFSTNAVNSHGDYVVGGTASGPAGLSGVIVYNGQAVIGRSRQPVDLNGDGLPNDSVYLYNIGDLNFLTEDGRWYFSAGLSNAGNQRIGEAFMWLPVPVHGDINCDESIDFFDIDPFLLALFDPTGYAAAYPDCWTITADINRDGFVDFFDIDPFVNCLFGGCGVQGP